MDRRTVRRIRTKRKRKNLVMLVTAALLILVMAVMAFLIGRNDGYVETASKKPFVPHDPELIIPDYASKGDKSVTNWMTWIINQHSEDGKKELHYAGCTVVSLQMMIQNSRIMKSNQLYGVTVKKDIEDVEGARQLEEYVEFDNTTKNYLSMATEDLPDDYDNWLPENVTEYTGIYCESDIYYEAPEGYDTYLYRTLDMVTGKDGVDFMDMTKARQTELLRQLWEEGYHILFCEMTDNAEPANGLWIYRSSHVCYVAGVNEDVWLADPTYGAYVNYTYKDDYHLVYLLTYKNEDHEKSPFAQYNAYMSQNS